MPDPTPSPGPSKGLQTWMGYGSSLGLFLAAALLTGLSASDVTDQPAYIQLAVLALGALLHGITGRNRSEQAVAMTKAADPRLGPPVILRRPEPANPETLPPLPPADGPA